MADHVSVVRARRGVKSGRRYAAMVAAVLAGSLLAPALVRADFYWDGQSTSWSNPGAWNAAIDGSGSAGVPTPTDMAIFSETAVTSPQTITLDGSTSVLGLSFQNTTPYTVAIGPGSPGNSVLTIGAGGMTISSGAGAIAISSDVTLNGGQTWTNNSTAGLTVSGNIAIGGNSLVLAGGSTTISGVISGAGGQLLINGGTVTLSNANNYTGGTTVSSAGTTLVVANSSGSATGSAAMLMATGTILTGSGTIAGAVSVNATARLDPHASSMATGTLNIGGDLTLADTSILDFNMGAPGGANNDMVLVTGNVKFGAFNTGIPLNINALSGFGAGTYELFGFTGNANTYTSGQIIPTGGPAANKYTISTAVAQEISLVVTPWVSLTLNWGGYKNVTWSSSPTTTNWTSNSSTTHVAYSAANAGSPVSFGDTDAFGTAVLNTSILVNAAFAPYSVTFSNTNTPVTGKNYTFLSTSTGGIGGACPLVMNGTGLVTIDNSNTYTGGTTINAGTIAINSAASLGNVSGGLTINGGTLEVTASFGSADARAITLGSSTSTILVDSGISYLSSGIVSGTGALIASGLGSLTLSGVNNYTGGTTLAGGTLVLAGSSVGAPLSITSGPIGTGSLTGYGTFQADDNTTGDRTIANALYITGSSIFAASGLTNKRALIFTGGDSISGTPVITFSDNQSGAGTSFQGLTTLNSSATFIGAGKASFTGGFNLANSATLTYNTTGTQIIAGPISATNIGQTLTINGTGNVTYGALSDGVGNAVALSISGSGTHTFTAAGTYSGGTTIGGTATVVINKPGALGTGNVTFTGTGPTLQLLATAGTGVSNFGGTAHTGWTFVGVNQAEVVTTAGGIDTLRVSNTLNVNDAAWYGTPVSYSAFVATFKYQGDTNSSGMTFTLENAAAPLTVYGGIRANGLGYVNGGGQQGPAVTPSAALAWIVGNDPNNHANTIVGGSNAALGTTFTPNTGVDLTSGHLIDFTITGSANSAVLGVTMFDETTHGSFTGSVTLTNTLANLLGGTTATIGFTAATSGGAGMQYISNFAYTVGYVGVFNPPNNVIVSANSTIDVSYSGGATMGTLAIGGNTLTVTNLSGGGATLALGATTLSGNPTFAPAAGVTLTLGALNDGGVARTITLNGAGALTLATPATSLMDGTTVIISAGKLNSNDPLALGGLAVVKVASGATFSIGASQTVGALGDQGGPVTNGASVLLNGYTLTIGNTDNRSSTFSGVIADWNGTGSQPGPGSLIKAGTGTLTLSGNSNYSGGTALQSGRVVLGVNNALPIGTTVTMGLGTSSATLDLGGFSQQIGGLALGAGASANAQTITNSSGTTGTLTYAGGTGASTFGGVISGNVALALNSGSLTLSGTSNNYNGGTTLVTGATLIVANASGTATGSGSVTLNGGALASPTTGGSIAGSVIAGTAGHTITPGGTGTIGTMGISGALTLNGNSTLNLNGVGTSYDSLAITGALTIASGTPTINLTLNALTGLASPLLATFGSTTIPTGNASGHFTITGTPLLGYSLLVDAHDLKLQAPTLNTWTGLANNGTTGSWDVGTTANWTPASPGTFASLDTALFDSTATGVRNVNLAAALQPTVALVNNDTSHNYTFSGTGKITGGGSLIKQGLGTLTVSNSGGNDYIGGTYIQNGTVAVGILNALPTAGTVTIGSTGNSGTLDLHGFGQTIAGLATAGTPSNQTITNNGGANATLTYAGGSSTFGGSITNGGPQTLLTVTSGLLSLVGSNSFTGATAVSGGTLSLDAASAITASPVTVSLTGVLTESVANALSGSASLTYNVTGGTLTLTQTNSYSGGTNIQNGTLQTGVVNALPAAGIVTIGSSGILDLNGNNQQIGVLAGTGTATITNSSTTANAILSIASASNYGGVINNGATKTTALAVTSGSTVTLSGSGNYSGGTSLSGGAVLNVNADTALGAANSTITFAGNSTLHAGTTLSTSRNVTINAGVTATIDTGSNTVSIGAVNGTSSAGLTKVGNGTLTLTTASTYAGTTLISGGTVKLGATPGTAAAAPLILSSAVVNLDATTITGNSPTVTYMTNLGSGGGSFSNPSPNGNTGATAAPGYNANAINGHAALVFNANATLGTIDAYVNSGNAISVFIVGSQPAGHATNYPGEVSFAGNAIVNDYGTAGNMAVDDGVNGTTPLTETDGAAGTASTLPTTAGTPFIWGTTVDTSATATSYADMVTPGTVLPVVPTNAATANSVPFAINQMLVGGRFTAGLPTNLWQGDIGKVLVFNTILSQADRTAVEAYLAGQWFSSSFLPAASPVQLASGATLDLNGYDQQIDSLSDAPGFTGGVVINSAAGTSATLTLLTTQYQSFSGSIQGSGVGLAVLGNGTQVLAGANNYGGATSVVAGTLSLAATNAISASAITVSGTGILTTSVPNAISGTASLTVVGSSVVLSSANSYSGGTVVSGGILTVAASGALGSGSLTLAGGTLDGGGGSVSNATTVTASSTLTASTGTLAFTGSVTINTGATLTSNPGSLAPGAPIVDFSGISGFSNSGILSVQAGRTNFGTRAINGVITTGYNAVLTAGSITSTLVTLNANSVLNIGGGTIGSLQIGGTPTINLQPNAYPQVSIISVPAGATVTLGTSASPNRLLVLSSTFTGVNYGGGGGKVDITNNSMLFQSASAPVTEGNLRGWLNNGYNGGNWGGSGFVTSLSIPATGGSAGIGYLSWADYHAFHPTATTFDGYTPGANDVVAMYTYMGDANLDGVITLRDYQLIDQGYLAGFDGSTNVATWVNGDFNYDGVVNYEDYALIDASVGLTTVLGQEMIAMHTEEFGAPYVQALNADLGAAVPEPASLMLLGLGAAGLLRRSRNRGSCVGRAR